MTSFDPEALRATVPEDADLEHIHPELRHLAVPVEDVRPDASNANTHPRRNLDQIEDSLDEYGYRLPLVARLDNGVLEAGHGRLKVSTERLGHRFVPVLFCDDTALEATKFAIMDNASAKSSEWDDSVLAGLLQSIESDQGDLDGTGFGEDDLDDLLAGLEQEQSGPRGKATDANRALDDIDELVAKWDPQFGDIWQIGKHRLLCGDATDPEMMEALLEGRHVDLVLSDPPYGIEVVHAEKTPVGGGQVINVGKVGGPGNWAMTQNYRKVKGDDTTETARRFWELCCALEVDDAILWGGNYFTDFLPPSRCWVVWDKRNGSGNNFADAELAWSTCSGGVRLFRWIWSGAIRRGEKRLEGDARFHPTQKPVGLHIEILREYSSRGAVVLDGFLGAGTTMIAAHEAGRVCYGLEYEPPYVAVILERMAQLGLEPRCVDTLDVEAPRPDEPTPSSYEDLDRPELHALIKERAPERADWTKPSDWMRDVLEELDA